MKQTITTILLGVPLVLAAQNPVIRDQFSADPTARVFNNKVYIYPSHDIDAPDGNERLKEWFCMADYHVFSSENLTDWTDHGVILSQERVPWGNPEAYSMWAPDCVEKDGKYYFYFPNAPKGEARGFAIGVATADRPEGPFTPEAEPIKGVSGIDPCVLVDNDGTSYIYWSGMGIRGARLKPNMKELDGELQEVKFPKREGMPEMPPMKVGGQVMEGLPDGFKEGPYAFKQGGWYYLTFPWVRQEGGTETLAYAMSKSPLGPWDFKGIIMAEHANRCWTNHHSITQYQGQWYLFYHHNDYSPARDKRRSVCIDKLYFNADGTIREVKPTLRGVGVTEATSRILPDRYSALSPDASIEYLDTMNRFRGWETILPGRQSWVRYDQVDFSKLNDAYVVVCAKANANTEFCLREKSEKGRIIARIPMTVISEMGPFRRDMSGQWITLTAALDYVPKGISDLVVTAGDEGVCIDWVQFKNRPRYFSAVTTPTAQPDADGYIRRWMLLEPIRQDIRSNVIFTNTWLEDAFAKTWFKGQQTLLPRDGQKVKVSAEQPDGQTTSQTLAWHALDSENYNVKLFRFAEKWGQQTYGSLFWMVTIIDCPEEMAGVRLAVGSNGASKWWLNGEPALLLEGDRRMVRDDGMSPRLTLKKGRNILRGAVINGPGLSDFCVRFLDENGIPVTNYTIKLQ